MMLVLDSYQERREVPVTINASEALGQESGDCLVPLAAGEQPLIILDDKVAELSQTSALRKLEDLLAHDLLKVYCTRESWGLELDHLLVHSLQLAL